MRRRHEYEKSPRQRMEWHGGKFDMVVLAGRPSPNVDPFQEEILPVPVRLQQASGTQLHPVAFPAGILRGETCSIARMTMSFALYDSDYRLQRVSYDWAFGLRKLTVDNEYIRDPSASGQTTDPARLNPLVDYRESWIVHKQGFWASDSRPSTIPFRIDNQMVDTTNSRVFEANDVLAVSGAVRAQLDTGSTPGNVDIRLRGVWRALMRLD